MRCSVVESLASFQPSVIPGCDVINHVTSQHGVDYDDRYRNSTRFFTSLTAQTVPPFLLSRNHRVFDDVTASRDPTNDVIRGAWPTFRLVLLCLDVVILLYRVCHICRAVDRMRNCWSRDREDRKYYCYYDYDDGDDVGNDDYSLAAGRALSREQRVKRNVAALSAVGRNLDETEYPLPVTSSSSSSSAGRPICRLMRSPVVAKLVLFAGLLTSCHLTLQLIDSCWSSSAHKLVSLASVSPALDTEDHGLTYGRQHDVTMTLFDQFVVNSLSHLSIVVQLVINGRLSVFVLH